MAINYTWNVSTVDTYPTLESNADVVKAAYAPHLEAQEV